MKSERQYQKQVNKSDKRKYYYDDTSNMKYEKSHLSQVAFIAGGVLAMKYGVKHGAFKKQISRAIEMAANYEGGFASKMHAFRDWVNFTDKAVVDSMKKKNPKWVNTGHVSNKKAVENKFKQSQMGKSIFRQQDYHKIDYAKFFKQSTRKEFWKEVGHNMDILLDKDRIKHTKSDFKGMMEFVKETQNTDASFLDSRLFKDYMNIKHSRKGFSKDVENSSKFNKSQKLMYEILMKTSVQSEQEKKEMIKRTGHRYATIGDFLSFNEEKKRDLNLLGFNAKNDMLYKENGTKKFKELQKMVQDLGKEQYVDKNGKTKFLYEHENFLNLRIDDSILIKEGKEEEKKIVSDLRGFHKYTDFFHRFATQDFKLPVIGLNPFRTLGMKGPREEVNFAYLSSKSIQNVLTGKEGKAGKLNKNMFFAKGTVYEILDDGSFEEVKRNMHIERVAEGSTVVSKELDSMRKMANLSKIERNEFNEQDGAFNNFIGKVSRKMDIGRQDFSSEDMLDATSDSPLNPKFWINKISSTLGDINPLKGHKGFKNQGGIGEDIRITKTYAQMFNDGGVDEEVFVAMNNGFSIKNIFSKDSAVGIDGDNLKKFLGQFFAGRHNLQDVNSYTSNFFFIFDRVNSGLAQTGFGLGTESLNSSAGIVKNMLLKRVLPVYMGYNIGEQVIYATERKDENDEYNGKSNIKKDIAKGIASMDLGYHKVKDFTGLTYLAKSFAKYMPGADQIGDLPVVDFLKLNKSYDDEIDYLKHGKYAVRKGAFWDTGTTAFTGGKVDYFKDNTFKEAMAEVDFSSVKYGSRGEYLENSVLPTIANPFAPIKHFITDKYHWDRKHYDDRPYMQTSPMFQEVPFVGPILSSTVGRVIKPVLSMHKEDLELPSFKEIQNYNSTQINLTGANEITTGGADGYGLASTGGPGSGVGSGYIPEIEQNYSTGKNYDVNKMPYVPVNANPGNVAGSFANDGLFFNHNNLGVNDKIVTQITQNDIDNSSASMTRDAYSTPFEGLNSSAGIKYNIGQTTEQMADFTGLYGFGAKSIATYAFGSGASKTKYIENSTYAYSMSRDFWNSEVGGIGGEGNEMIRRFLMKRTKDANLYNPIRNTMPNWMPGDDYFVDFKHGDPYVKIANGEMRLPGEGYERLNGIKPLDFKIGASFLGKSKEEIMNHYMNNDEITSQGGKSAISRSKEIKSRVLSEITNQHKDYILQKNGRVHDVQNDIDGKYDLRIRDDSNDMGQSLMQIKVVNQEKFDEVQSSNNILDDTKAQMNFLLNQTGLTNAYVTYVNRDDETQRVNLNMEYDKGNLKDSISKLNQAKEDLNTMLDNGTIARSDFYSPMDKLRILGDVAPYSKEYDQMASYVSNMKLSKDEKAELKAIKERVSQQRQPKRLYEYQYKDIETRTTSGTVDTVFSDNTFTLKGTDGRYRLAGVDIKSEEDWREDAQEKIASGEAKEGYSNDYLMQKQDALIKSYLHKGSHISLEYNENQVDRTSASGISKVIVTKGTGNLNKELLSEGYATENDGKTDVDVKVKTTGLGRFAGSLWETYAHIDTPFHTKWLQVRDAKEDYERDRVYSKHMAQWNHPISDYLKPLVVDRNISRNFLMGLAIGVGVGKQFGNSPFGRLVGATTVALTVTGGKFFTYGYQIIKGEKWRPERVRKEQEMDDYVDKLKFLKYRKLYEEYSSKSNVNINKILENDKKNKDHLNKRLGFIGRIARKLKENEANGRGSGLLSFTSASSLEGYNPLMNALSSLEQGKKGLIKALITDFRYEHYKDTHDVSNIENAKVDKDHEKEEYIAKVKDHDLDIKINGKTDVRAEYDKALDDLQGHGITEKNLKRGISNSKKLLAAKFSTKNPVAKSKINYDKLATLSILQKQLADTSIDDDLILDNLKDVGLEPYMSKKGKLLRERTLKDVNTALESLGKSLGVDEAGLKALMYNKLSEQTMYAFDEGDNIEDFAKALPKADKDYFSSLAKAPDSEKVKILDLAPKYMRRGLEAEWGLKVEKKDNLQQYFTRHALPDEDWKGWGEETDLNSVKVKMIRKENMDFRQNNVWEDDVRKANSMGQLPVPKINARSTNAESRRTMMALLKQRGYEDVQVRDGSLTGNTKLYITADKKAQYREELKQRANEALN